VLDWHINTTSDVGSAMPVGRAMLVLRLSPSNFLIGRDGDCCFALAPPDALQPSRSVTSRVAFEQLQRTAPSNKSCLLRLDQRVMLLEVMVHLNASSTNFSVQQMEHCSAGNSEICGLQEKRSFISLATKQRYMAHSSLDVFLRGSMFANPVTWQRIPLQAVVDAPDPRLLELLEEDIGSEGMDKLKPMELVAHF
jgi:hypothetical protein